MYEVKTTNCNCFFVGEFFTVFMNTVGQCLWQSIQLRTRVHFTAPECTTSISYLVITPLGSRGLDHVTAIELDDLFHAFRLETLDGTLKK